MHFPIPGGKAEEAARDFASDLRALASQAVPLKEAIEKGEASDADRANYSTLIEQIKSMSDCVFVCTLSGKEYRVGDYVTLKREMQANVRKALLRAGQERLKRLLH